MRWIISWPYKPGVPTTAVALSIAWVYLVDLFADHCFGPRYYALAKGIHVAEADSAFLL